MGLRAVREVYKSMAVSQNGSFPMGIVRFIQALVLSQAVGMFPTIRTVLMHG